MVHLITWRRFVERGDRASLFTASSFLWMADFTVFSFDERISPEYIGVLKQIDYPGQIPSSHLHNGEKG